MREAATLKDQPFSRGVCRVSTAVEIIGGNEGGWVDSQEPCAGGRWSLRVIFGASGRNEAQHIESPRHQAETK